MRARGLRAPVGCVPSRGAKTHDALYSSGEAGQRTAVRMRQGWRRKFTSEIFPTSLSWAGGNADILLRPHGPVEPQRTAPGQPRYPPPSGRSAARGDGKAVGVTWSSPGLPRAGVAVASPSPPSRVQAPATGPGSYAGCGTMATNACGRSSKPFNGKPTGREQPPVVSPLKPN